MRDWPFFLSISSFLIFDSVSANPIDCRPFFDEPIYLSNNDNKNLDSNSDYTIQCAGGPQIWGGIRSSAKPVRAKGNIYQFEKSGGSSAARKDFQKMPGKEQSVGSGAYIKTDGGKTVTYYNARSEGYGWTLRYPYLSNSKVDKIRYLGN